jgi:hypothetical protein
LGAGTVSAMKSLIGQGLALGFSLQALVQLHEQVRWPELSVVGLARELRVEAQSEGGQDTVRPVREKQRQ